MKRAGVFGRIKNTCVAEHGKVTLPLLVYCVFCLVVISALAADIGSLGLLALWRRNCGGYPLLAKTSSPLSYSSFEERQGSPRKSYWFLKVWGDVNPHKPNPHNHECRFRIELGATKNQTPTIKPTITTTYRATPPRAQHFPRYVLTPDENLATL